MRRVAVAVIVAILATAAYAALVYVFFVRVWPLLPVWANILIVIVLALSFITAPMALLLRLGRMPKQRY